MRDRPGRVLLVVDDRRWALGSLGKALEQTIPHLADLHVRTISEAEFTTWGTRTIKELSRADLIHWISTVTWHRFGSDRLGSKSLVSLHHLAPDEAWKVSMRKPGWICAHSNDGSRQVAECSSHTVEFLLPYGFDPEEHAAIGPSERTEERARLGIPEKAFVVGVFANALSSRKGIPLLRTVLQKISSDTPVHLVVSGRGWGSVSSSLSGQWTPFTTCRRKRQVCSG